VQTVADSAADGDTLLFFPGTHQIELSLVDKGLVLMGQGGAASVILTRTPGHVMSKPGLVRMQATGGKSFRAIGLTFQAGVSLGRIQAGGISLSGVSNVWLEECAFVGNLALLGSLPTTNRGGAVQVEGANAVTIRDCTFDDNRTAASPNLDSSGGAISIAAASITITGSRFTGNVSEGHACGGTGGAISVGGNSVSISDCEFRENVATTGAAVHAVGGVTMERCVVIDNVPTANAGFCGQPPVSVVYLSGDVTLRESVLLDNDGPGSALFIQPSGNIRIERSTIAFNGEAGSQQPAIQLSGVVSSSLTFQRNLVAFNRGPGIIHNVPTNSGVACNIIWGNSPDFLGVTDWRGSFDNQASDPLFCPSAEPGITVAANSPTLPGGEGHPESCGAIGVVESACPAVGVKPTTWSAIKSRRGR
jgi:hypothetical protein